MAGRDRDEIVDVLAERFDDAGIELSSAELEIMAESMAQDRGELPEGTFEAYREQEDPE